MEERVLFVVNDLAGGKDKTPFWACLDQALSARPFPHQIYRTTGLEDAAAIQGLLRDRPFTRAIAVGGDGTVRLVAEQLVRRPISLGIIPLGSANGLARELGLPWGAREALKVALGSHTIPIDAIHVERHGWCVHLCDLGLNASLVEHYHARQLRGMWGYGRVFLKTILQRTRFRVYLANERLRLNRTVFMVMLANARKFGTGALVNPKGSLRDGRFEVLLMKDFRWWDLARVFNPWRTPAGRREEIVSVEAIEIGCNRPIHFQIDGEYRGKVNRLKAVIVPGCLRVLVPAPKDTEF